MAPPMLPEKPCAHCRQPFRPTLSTRQFCGRKCSAQSRGRENYQAMGRKGGIARGEKHLVTVLATYKQMVAGLEPWEAFKAGAKWQRRRTQDQRTTQITLLKRMRAELAAQVEHARREAYAQGWSHAIGETSQRRSA